MRIRWTQPAAQDLRTLSDYIKENDGPERARKVALQIYDDISELAGFPVLAAPDGGKARASRYSKVFLSSLSMLFVMGWLKSFASCMEPSAIRSFLSAQMIGVPC